MLKWRGGYVSTRPTFSLEHSGHIVTVIYIVTVILLDIGHVISLYPFLRT